MSISSHLAAHHILSCLQEGTQTPVTPLKLIKLVYISHGYHLAMTDEPLIREAIEAWKYGPVVPEIYHAVKEFKTAIPLNLFEHYETDDNNASPNSIRVIGKVVAAYGKYDGLKLSSATHQKGTPWEKIYNKGGHGAKIPNDLIKVYYKKLYGTAS